MDSLVHLILVYRYWILFPIACFEGPITGFIVGTLVALGYFDPFAAYALLVSGDVIPDWLYYLLGRYGADRPFVKRTIAKVGFTDHMEVIKKLWHEHGGKTMFFSKLAYGLSTAFLISAGLTGLTPKKFLLYALPVTLVQYLILMGLGYYFGSSYYTLITGSFEGIGILIAAVIVVAVLYIMLTRYMRKRLLESEKEAEK